MFLKVDSKPWKFFGTHVLASYNLCRMLSNGNEYLWREINIAPSIWLIFVFRSNMKIEIIPPYGMKRS